MPSCPKHFRIWMVLRQIYAINIYTLFPQFFLGSKANPQFVSFLECMIGSNTSGKMADAVKLLLCLLSMAVSNLSCVALVSFFLTTLPTKRNLFTFFDIALVLSLTSVVDISVRFMLTTP